VSLARGEIYRVSPPPGNDPKRARCVAIVSRQTLCDSRADKVICVPINTDGDGRSTEVPIGVDEGLKHPSFANCDQLILVPKSALTHYVGSLKGAKLVELRAALRAALELE
jgi:mRNA interferase MazF